MAGTGDNIGVGIQVTLTDNASSQLKELQKIIETLNKSLKAIDVSPIDKLVKSLTSLDKSLGGSTTKNIEKLNTSLAQISKVPTQAADTITKLGTAISTLKITKAQTKNIGTLGTSLQKVGTGANALNNVKNIEKLATAVNRFDPAKIRASGEALKGLGSGLVKVSTGSKIKPETLTATGEALKTMHSSVSRIKPNVLLSFAEALKAVRAGASKTVATNLKSMATGFGNIVTKTQGINTRGIGALARALTAMKDAVSGRFSGSINNIANSFKNLSASITPGLAERIRLVSTSIKKLEAPNLGQTNVLIRSLTNEINRLSKEAPKAGESTKKATKEIEKMRPAADSARMGLVQLSQQSALTSFAGIVDSMVLLYAAVRSFQPAIEFEASMDRVRAVANASEGDMRNLTASVLEMGRTTIFSAAEAAQGMLILTQAGFDATDALQALPTVLELAAAGGIQVSEAASIATSTMHGFGMEAQDLAHLMDVIAVAAMNSNTNISELGRAMRTAAPIARAAGEDIEELTTILGAMANAGIKGSNAGQNYKRMVLRLISPTGKAKAALEELGVETVDANGKLRDLTMIMKDLNNAGLNLQQSKDIFGLWSAAAALAVSQNANSLAELNMAITSSDGALSAMARTMTDNMQGALKKFKDSVVQILINGLLPFVELITPLVLKLRDLAAAFAEWVENADKGKVAFAGAIVVSLALLAALNAFFIGVTRAIGGLIRFVQLLRAFKIVAAESDTTLTKLVATKLNLSAESIKNLASQKRETLSIKEQTKEVIKNTTAWWNRTKATLASHRAAGLGGVKIAAQTTATTIGTVANNAFALSVNAVAKAIRVGLVNAVSFLMGPWGILILTVASLIGYFWDTEEAAESTTKRLSEMAKAAQDATVRLTALTNEVVKLNGESTTGDTLKAFGDLAEELNRLSTEGPKDVRDFAKAAYESIDTVTGGFYDGGAALQAYQKELNSLTVKAAEAKLEDLKAKIDELNIARIKAELDDGKSSSSYEKANAKYIESIRKREQIEKSLAEGRVIAAQQNLRNMEKLGQAVLDLEGENAEKFISLNWEKFAETEEIARQAYETESKFAIQRRKEEKLNAIEIAKLRIENQEKSYQAQKATTEKIAKELADLQKARRDAFFADDMEEYIRLGQQIEQLTRTQKIELENLKGEQIKLANTRDSLSKVTLAETQKEIKYQEALGNTYASSRKGLVASYQEAEVAIDSYYKEEVKKAAGNEAALKQIEDRKAADKAVAAQELATKLQELDNEYLDEFRNVQEVQTEVINREYDKRIKKINEFISAQVADAGGNPAKLAQIEQQKTQMILAAQRDRNDQIAEMQQEADEAALEIADANREVERARLEKLYADQIIDKELYTQKLIQLDMDAAQEKYDNELEVFRRAEKLKDKDIRSYERAVARKLKAEAEFAQKKVALQLRSRGNEEAERERQSQLLEQRLQNELASIDLLTEQGVIKTEKGEQRKLEVSKRYAEKRVSEAEKAVKYTLATYGRDSKQYLDAVANKIAAERRLQKVIKETNALRGVGGGDKPAPSKSSQNAKALTGMFSYIQRIANKVSDSAYASAVGFRQTTRAIQGTSERATELSKVLNEANQKAAKWNRVGGVFAVFGKRLSRIWQNIAREARKALAVQTALDKAGRTTVDTYEDIYRGEQAISALLGQRNAMTDEQLQKSKSIVKTLADQITAQKKLNAEANRDTKIASVQAKLDAAKEAGVNIEEYGFDEENKERLTDLEDEIRLIDDAIAQEEYRAYQQIRALKEKGATQAAIDKAEADSRKILDDLEYDKEGFELEFNAIDSKLNLEMINLKVINDLKIKQFEEELAREQQLHEKRIANIEAEGAERARALAQTFESDSPATAKFARGGRLPGNGTQDTVTVRARPGEWFIRNESANMWSRKFGDGFMQGINNPLSSTGRAIMNQLSSLSNVASPRLPSAAYSPPTAGMQAFAEGGMVASESSGPTTRITLQAPSGQKVNANVEGSVNQFLNILQEAGLRA